ncbi:tripartite tricarboxylate transporter TctB family protein [Nocardiopsis halotolerans]|uniref:tripartite tricarboxylate transporter TctB family protein n=1 Tax=Nocardiopsis halotolerans TaxID=124252 RepID=UPI000348F46C|nr:tripartite tricarboxylate transporter TctB family protein [Nocardiopsis halotolerans]
MTSARPTEERDPAEAPSSENPAENPGGSPDGASAGKAEPAIPTTALAVPAVILMTALVLVVGSLTIRAPESGGFLGPRFFPLTVGVLLAVTACASGVRAVVRARSTSAMTPATSTASAPSDGGTGAVGRGDWRSLGIMAATLTAHVLLLQPLGWLLSGTLLFWGISFALDRRSPLLDLCVAVILAALVQICFSGLLDVSLPSGLLGKVM